MTGLIQDSADIIDGEVLFAEDNHLFSHRVCFRRGLGTFLRREEEFSFGILAELVTEDPETAGGITKAAGSLGGGEAFDKVGPEGFILTVGGIGGFEKEAGHVC
jgi:hypothetical protein